MHLFLLPFTPSSAPDGNLDIQVDAEKDIRFQRYRRETVNLFELAKQVGGLDAGLKAAVDDSATKMRAEVETAKKTLIQSSAAQFLLASDGQNQKVAAAQKKVDELAGSVDQKLKDQDARVKKSLEVVAGDVDGLKKKEIAQLTKDLAAVNSKLAATAKCASEGKVLIGSACAVNTEKNTKSKCDANALGATRYNTAKGLMEVCTKTGDKHEFKTVSSGSREPGDGKTKLTPARDGMEIWEVSKKQAKSGYYWIQPDGDAAPAETYCEFNDVKFRGYCLASYGYLASRGGNGNNRNMVNMNNPGVSRACNRAASQQRVCMRV